MARICLPRVLGACLVGCFVHSAPGAEPATGCTSRPSGAAPSETVVWFNDFQQTINPHGWGGSPAATPDGAQRFLGEFASSLEPQRFSLRDLPPHTFLRVEFDLYLIRSWDGSETLDVAGSGTCMVGPDVWEAWVDHGPQLVRASFALFTRDGGRQSFPDPFPFAIHPHGTGAAARNSLGFDFEGTPMDAVYHFDLCIPHTSDAVQLNFRLAGSGEGLDGESWGLDNFRVSVLSKSPLAELDADALEALCADFRAGDPVKAFASGWKLISAGDRAVPALRACFAPQPVDREGVRKLVARLDAPNFRERNDAASALEQMGPAIEGELRRALERGLSHEAASRVRELLEHFRAEDRVDLHTLARVRAIHALEVIASPAAHQVLAEIVEGPHPRQLQKLAEEALGRFEAARALRTRK